MKKQIGKPLMQKWKNKIGGKLSALDKKKLVLTNLPYALAAFYADRAFFLYRNSPGEDMQNEMKLTDESWISYQQGKGNEEYQKYMEDLTDMQNHVLPYLQSFCSLEEKGVQERREQKIAEKNESRETVPRTGVEANTAVKDAGKAERKTVEQKKAMARKEKKPSIHERLEINKRIIQEKQGKDKPARGADLSVRTV